MLDKYQSNMSMAISKKASCMSNATKKPSMMQLSGRKPSSGHANLLSARSLCSAK